MILDISFYQTKCQKSVESKLEKFFLIYKTRYARVEKYIQNVSKFVSCKKIRRKCLDNTRESELPG